MLVGALVVMARNAMRADLPLTTPIARGWYESRDENVMQVAIGVTIAVEHKVSTWDAALSHAEELRVVDA